MPTDGWQVLVAFNNGPMDDPALITTVAAPGTPGVTPPTLGGVNVWTDISQYVRRYEIGRGRQHELARFEAGELHVDLWNILSAAFNPWNTSGPFYGLLLPGKPIQVRRTYSNVTYKRYTGYVHAWPVKWPDQQIGQAQIQASDAFRTFALANITSTQYAPAILADTPTAYFRLGDPIGSSTVADASGHGHVGTCQGAVGLGASGALPSDSDTAASLGNKSGYIALDNAAITAPGSGAFSFELWASLSQVPEPNGNMMFSFWRAPSVSNDDNISVGAYPHTGLTKADILFVISYGGLVNIATASAVLPYDGTWHHIVCVRQSDGLTLQVYVDGVLAATLVAGSIGVFGTVAQASLGGTEWSTGGALHPDWPGALDEFASYNYALTAAQALAHYNAGAGQWARQTSGVRIGHVLDTIGWSAGARSIDAGSTTIQAVTSSLVTTKSLVHMQAVEETEDGALYMTTDGKVKFVARWSLITGSYLVSQITFGDGAGEAPFQPDPEMALDDLDLWNEFVVQRAGGVPQSAIDSASVGQYFRRTQNISNLLHTTDAESADRAQWGVVHFSQPIYRLRNFTARPTASPASIAAIMNLDLLQRVTIHRGYIPGGGTAFSQQAMIERMTETMDAESGDWVLSFAVSPSETKTYWILDDTTYSVLGTTTIPAY